MPDANRNPTPVLTDADQVVCHCMDVTRDRLRAAIDGGARSISDLQDTTSACTGCGTCREDLLNMLPPRRHGHGQPEAS